jgi:hypothetical protein
VGWDGRAAEGIVGRSLSLLAWFLHLRGVQVKGFVGSRNEGRALGMV